MADDSTYPSPNKSVYPIPQSNALAQADPKSLQELFSRDPETYPPDAFKAVVQYMREFRERLAASETVRQPRAKREKVADSYEDF